MNDIDKINQLKYELSCCENFRRYEEIRTEIEKILKKYSRNKSKFKKNRFKIRF